MFIDFLTLMLINMSAGLVILAAYLYRGIDEPDQKKWVPAFAVTGLIALLNGFFIIWTWPLPGSYNSSFGEMSVLFGALFTGAALALAYGWDLIPLAIYAFFAGFASVVIGVRLINLGLTSLPILSGTGFILSGLAGIFAAPLLYLRNNRIIRLVGAAILLLAAIIWAFTGYGAYWMHMASFAKWLPSTMR